MGGDGAETAGGAASPPPRSPRRSDPGLLDAALGYYSLLDHYSSSSGLSTPAPGTDEYDQVLRHLPHWRLVSVAMVAADGVAAVRTVTRWHPIKGQASGCFAYGAPGMCCVHSIAACAKNIHTCGSIGVRRCTGA